MAAAFGINGDQHQALRAFFFGGSGLNLFFLESGHAADCHEHAERDDSEIDDLIDENAVIDGDGGDAFAGAAECEFQVIEINIAHQKTYRRHQKIIDHGRNDFSESAADDDSHRHIDDISPQREGFKVL